MKRLLVLSVGVCLFASMGLVIADQKDDEAAIKKVITDLFDTHNRGDGEGMVALYDGGGYFNYTGKTKKADAIEAVASRQKNNVEAELIKDMGAVFLKPDVAIQRRITQYSGPKGTDGKPFTVWNQTASVLMKKNGDWLIVAQFYKPMTDDEMKEMKQTEN